MFSISTSPAPQLLLLIASALSTSAFSPSSRIPSSSQLAQRQTINSSPLRPSVPLARSLLHNGADRACRLSGLRFKGAEGLRMVVPGIPQDPFFDGSEDEKPWYCSSDDETDNKMDYFGESARGSLLPGKKFTESQTQLSPSEVASLRDELNLDQWGTPKDWNLPAQPQRAVFCSRTINLGAVKCIGYDMDYTLIHYNIIEWEGRAYHYAKENLRQVGFPVDDLVFDPELVCRGIIIDKQLGNLIKVDRFGYVRRALHGTNRLTQSKTSEVYGRLLVDLRESRWVFLNTLFSVSEACLYTQLVEKLDAGKLQVEDITGQGTKLTYSQLFNAVSTALFKAHVEGRLKTDVMNDPDRYVEFDPDLPLTLLDQKHAGKKLALVTNSDWEYTRRMMTQVMDRFLPHGMTWRDLFDVVMVSSRKPAFFSQKMPLYEIVTEDGMMREKFKLKEGRIYSGGSASMVETLFDCSADQIMYIGDHIFTDVNVANKIMRWRTALIVREIEEEVVAMDRGRAQTRELQDLIKKREQCSNIVNHVRTELNRYHSNGRSVSTMVNPENEAELQDTLGKLLSTMNEYDKQIAPLMYKDGGHFNKYWGYLSRGGFGGKSHLMRQVEKYADVYTSRVANFLRYTPYHYFRSSTQSLAHHRNLDKFRQELPTDVLMDPDEYAKARDFLVARPPEDMDGKVDQEYVDNYKPKYNLGPLAATEGDGDEEQNLWGLDSMEFGHSIASSGISSLDEPGNSEVNGKPSANEEDAAPQMIRLGKDEDGNFEPVQPR
mmetsp:Transcript_9338/g.14729  ORF Transcript_9338/g.14729 Transcript_9338/m.14729 type:complete len:773 (+) Transcript_9338:291-2609(+)